MSYRNNRLNRRMLSLEAVAGKRDSGKWRVLSDGGAGEAQIVSALDYDAQAAARAEAASEQAREEALFAAEMRLADAGLSHLIGVLLLIVENGNNREASQTRVSRRTYFSHRRQLLDFFGA